MTSKRKTFYPYAFADEELSLTVVDLNTDGTPQSERIAHDNMTVSMQDLDDWDTASLSLRVSLPDEQVPIILPPEDNQMPPWRLRVAISCEKTRWRRGYLLAQLPNENTWAGTIEVHRAQLRDVVKLYAYLVRTTASINKKFGSQEFVRLASSSHWEILVDQPAIPPGNHLEVRWEDFKSSAHPVRQNNGSLLYYLDFSESPPVLWLNEGLTDLKAVLMSLGTVGSKAAVRNTMFDSIAQSTWMSLVLHAANAAPDPDSEPPEEWQKGVLAQVASLVYPDSSKELAVKQLVSDARDRDQLPTLLESLIVGIQTKLSISKSASQILNIVG